jgi:hypothetical protein
MKQECYPLGCKIQYHIIVQWYKYKCKETKEAV